MNSAFGVDNLSASTLLNYSGKLIKFLSERLRDRPSGITFFCFDFRIDPNQEYYRIQRDPFCFLFSLRLPQQHFDTLTKKVEGICSTEKTKSQQSTRKAWGVSTILGGGSQYFSTPEIIGTINTQLDWWAQNPPTSGPISTPKWLLF